MKMHFMILMLYIPLEIITKSRMDIDMNVHISKLFLFELLSFLRRRMADNVPGYEIFNSLFHFESLHVFIVFSYSTNDIR